MALLALSACSIRDAACGKSAPSSQSSEGPRSLPATSANAGAKTGVTIVFLGDSLTAGIGLLSQQAFPAEDRGDVRGRGLHRDRGRQRRRCPATRAPGGLRRVEQVLDPPVKILVVALGGNDALRGLTVQQTQENLRQIIDIAQARGVAVMLCGMEAPTNLGEDYRTAFKQVYFDLLRCLSTSNRVRPVSARGRRRQS